jgi:hypothetical protein
MPSRAAILRRRTLAVLLAIGVGFGVLVAVLIGGDDSPGPVTGTPKEAVEVVDAFQSALAARDFAKVCDELYTIEAREAAGGADCQSVLAQATARLSQPRMRIVSLSVYRGGAVVSVEASEKGHRAVQDSIRLVRQRGRFRIASAGPPADR